MTQKIIVFDFGGVLFKTSITEFYRERFEAQGRSKDDLRFFLDNVLTKKGPVSIQWRAVAGFDR